MVYDRYVLAVPIYFNATINYSFNSVLCERDAECMQLI